MTDERTRDIIARQLVNHYRSRSRVGGVPAPKLQIADNPDGPWIDVYGDASEESVNSADEILTDNDLRTRTFYIPRQYTSGNTGTLTFPPEKGDGAEALFTGYQIRFKDQIAQFAVQSWKSAGFGAQFEFVCVNYRTQMYGLVQ